MSTIENIKKSLDKIRPGLQVDGGDVELVDFNKATGVVSVCLTGRCAGCPMAEMTLKEGIEVELKKDVPEVTAVEAV